MRILMLGNSYTYYNDLPAKVAELTGAEVVSNALDNAKLEDHTDPSTEAGAKTQKLLEEKWDYVIIQEYSSRPVLFKGSFLVNSMNLSKKMKEKGATPVFFETWAYERGSNEMNAFSKDYDEMYYSLYASYHEAANMNQGLIACVGERFYDLADTEKLYAEDGCHPNEKGTEIAAKEIAAVIMEDNKNR